MIFAQISTVVEHDGVDKFAANMMPTVLTILGLFIWRGLFEEECGED